VACGVGLAAFVCFGWVLDVVWVFGDDVFLIYFYNSVAGFLSF